MIGALPWGALDQTPPGAPSAYRLADDAGPVFLVAEIEVYRPATATAAFVEPWGAAAWGAVTQSAAAFEDFTTLRAADLGYVTRATDPAGLQIYPPLLGSGVSSDRALELGPNGQGAAAGWGELRLINEAGALNSLAASRNVDGRPVRVRLEQYPIRWNHLIGFLALENIDSRAAYARSAEPRSGSTRSGAALGRKQALSHGVWRDPAWDETAELLHLLGASLTLDDRELRIGLRDPKWLERVAAEQAAAAKAREVKAAAAETLRLRLEALARQGETAWRETETEIERRNAAGYDRALALLRDLRALAERGGTLPDFAARLAAIEARHARKARFVERLAALR